MPDDCWKISLYSNNDVGDDFARMIYKYIHNYSTRQYFCNSTTTIIKSAVNLKNTITNYQLEYLVF